MRAESLIYRLLTRSLSPHLDPAGPGLKWAPWWSLALKEAEHIMDQERGRLIPPHQAPFSALYGADERSAASDAGAVGSYWPSFMPMARER